MEDLKAAIEKYSLTNAPELQNDERLNTVRSYCILLWIKNEQMNLTRHTDWDQFVSRDLVDTIQLSRQIPKDQEVLDVGSGGGVPGMLLSIIRPDLTVTLTDSVGKKSAALQEFATALELEIQVCHERAEKLYEDFRYDVTTARAVGPLSKICRWFQPHWLSVGRLLAIKGPKWVEEKAAADEVGLLQNLEVKKLVEYPTPGTEWNSVILEIRSARS